MKLKYQTAIATLIQFITLTLLNVADTLNSVITTCRSSHPDCVSNTILSLIVFLLIAGWFAFVWIIGYLAQEKRSKKLALLLILIEAIIGLFALFNAKHHTDILSLLTSLIDLGLAVWVILLAFRLVRADGGRVVTRSRRRRTPPPKD